MLLLWGSNLLVFFRWFIVLGAAARMGQLEDWFRSWVPDSVFSAGGGRSSVEAWYTTALDIEEVLSGLLILIFTFLLLMLVQSFDTVDR